MLERLGVVYTVDSTLGRWTGEKQADKASLAENTEKFLIEHSALLTSMFS